MILKPHTLVADKELGDNVYVDFLFDVFRHMRALANLAGVN